jgi:Leucine-rich repeat (LRR) protein
MIMKDENIGRMPKNMQILSHISKVDLSKNSIKTLSDGIADIVGLQELILGHNQLVELPNTTKKLTNLKILDVRSNSLTELPDMWGMKKLQNLNVADNELEYINDSVQSLSSLTVLDVRYNQLRDYTHALCDLVDNLCTVYFDYNFVTHFPKPIGRCNGLRSLNMSKNEMTTLPIGCIEYMTGLTKLDLSQNWLTDIPSTIGINQGLRELILNNNRIVVAPRSLMALTGLVILNLACNHVKRVPEITTLTSLTELRLENNCLERIPVRLYYLTKLKVLETRGNDNLHTPPASIACQGKRSIFQWLAEEDVREQKAGLFDQRLQRIMQHIVKTFQSKEALQRAFDAVSDSFFRVKWLSFRCYEVY